MDDLNLLRNKFNTQQRDILAAIWRYYVRGRSWVPSRVLHAGGGGKNTIRPTLEQFGGSVVFEQEENGILYYRLTYLGILLSPIGEHLEDLLTNYLLMARALALQEPNRTHVSSLEALTHLHLSPDELTELGCILFLSPFLAEGSFGKDIVWNACLPKDIEDVPDDPRPLIQKIALADYDPKVPLQSHDRHEYYSTLRSKSLKQHLQQDFSSPSKYQSSKNRFFLSPDLIDQLIGMNTENLSFDLTRLIRYCQEINNAFEINNYHSVIFLARAILDHCPPIFGQPNFESVAAQVGGKPFSEITNRLNLSLKKIADYHIHKQISKKEVLPVEEELDFSNDLNFLLGRIVERLHNKTPHNT